MKKQKSDSQIINNERITVNQWIVIFFLFVLIIVLRWNSFSVPFERDEGEYAYSAWLMRHNIMPYENAFIQKPPMIIYTFILGQLISESSIIVPRILALIFVVLSTLLTGFVVKRTHGNWTGIFAMCFMTPMLTLPAFTSFAANTEIFMILPLLGVLALYVLQRSQAKSIHWFWAGVFSAVALLYKPIAITVIGFIFGVWLVETWRANKEPFVLMKNLFLAILGGIGTALLIILPFLIHESGKTLWECAGQFNIYYAQSEDLGYDSFLYFFNIFLSNWWILLILLVWYLMVRPTHWWFYILIFVVSILTIFRTPLGHYYIMVVPFWAIVSALSVNSILEKFKQAFSKRGDLKIISIAIILVFLLVLPNMEQFSKSPEEFCKWIYSDINPFVEAKVVAEHVAALSTSEDNVFIAGSEPEILYYAKRKSSTRFVIMYPLMMNTPFAMQYQKETIDALKQKPPEVLVFAKAQTSWLAQPNSPRLIINYINSLFATQYNFVGGTLYDTKQWYDTLDTERYQRASLVVFKKKTQTQ